MNFKNLVVCLSVLSAFSAGCHERDFNSESDGVKSTFKGPLGRKTKRHFVFGVAAPGSKGDKQCWYEAKSEWNDSRADSAVIKEQGANIFDRYLSLAQAEPLLENQFLMLDKTMKELDNKKAMCAAAPALGDNNVLYKTTPAYIQRMALCSNKCEQLALLEGCQAYWQSQKDEAQSRKSNAQKAFAAMKAEKATMDENGVTLSEQVQSRADADAQALAEGMKKLNELLPSLKDDGAACPAASTLKVTK